MGLGEIALLILLGSFTSSFNQLMGCWLKAGLGWPWLHNWGVLAHSMCLFSSRPVRNVHMEMAKMQTNRNMQDFLRLGLGTSTPSLLPHFIGQSNGLYIYIYIYIYIYVCVCVCVCVYIYSIDLTNVLHLYRRYSKFTRQ